jgi:hypothetical protein
MFRLLTTIAVVAALAVSVLAASASARVGGKMHLDDISLGIVTDDTKTATSAKPTWPWW